MKPIYRNVRSEISGYESNYALSIGFIFDVVSISFNVMPYVHTIFIPVESYILYEFDGEFGYP